VYRCAQRATRAGCRIAAHLATRAAKPAAEEVERWITRTGSGGGGGGGTPGAAGDKDQTWEGAMCRWSR